MGRDIATAARTEDHERAGMGGDRKRDRGYEPPLFTMRRPSTRWPFCHLSSTTTERLTNLMTHGFDDSYCEGIIQVLDLFSDDVKAGSRSWQSD